MSVIAHAKSEMEIAGVEPEARETIIKVMELFFDEFDSGGAVSIGLDMLHRLISCHPLTPLTGDDSEWMSIYESYGIGSPDEKVSVCYQNVRAPGIFKDVYKDGRVVCYQSDYYVKKYPDGNCFLSQPFSRKGITFPYYDTHKKKMVYVDEEGNIVGDENYRDENDVYPQDLG